MPLPLYKNFATPTAAKLQHVAHRTHLWISFVVSTTLEGGGGGVWNLVLGKGWHLRFHPQDCWAGLEWGICVSE